MRLPKELAFEPLPILWWFLLVRSLRITSMVRLRLTWMHLWHPLCQNCLEVMVTMRPHILLLLGSLHHRLVILCFFLRQQDGISIDACREHREHLEQLGHEFSCWTCRIFSRNVVHYVSQLHRFTRTGSHRSVAVSHRETYGCLPAQVSLESLGTVSSGKARGARDTSCAAHC